VLDPTIAAPVTNVAEYGFEGRFEDWAGDARYFEYSTAADPIASGHTSKVPATWFGRDLYADAPTSIIPLDQSGELGIKGGAATSPGLLASFIRIRAGERVSTLPERHLPAVLRPRGPRLRGGERPSRPMGEG